MRDQWFAVRWLDLPDAFVQALETLTKLKDESAFGGWISSMIVGRVAKVIRKRRLLQRLGLRQGEPIVLDEVIGRACPADMAAELRKIYSVLESMPADLRITLILRRVEGSTIEEVAELMDASPATVKRRLARAEETLNHFRGRDES